MRQYVCALCQYASKILGNQQDQLHPRNLLSRGNIGSFNTLHPSLRAEKVAVPPQTKARQDVHKKTQNKITGAKVASSSGSSPHAAAERKSTKGSLPPSLPGSPLLSSGRRIEQTKSLLPRWHVPPGGKRDEAQHTRPSGGVQDTRGDKSVVGHQLQQIHHGAFLPRLGRYPYSTRGMGCCRLSAFRGLTGGKKRLKVQAAWLPSSQNFRRSSSMQAIRRSTMLPPHLRLSPSAHASLLHDKYSGTPTHVVKVQLKPYTAIATQPSASIATSRGQATRRLQQQKCTSRASRLQQCQNSGASVQRHANVQQQFLRGVHDNRCVLTSPARARPFAGGSRPPHPNPTPQPDATGTRP